MTGGVEGIQAQWDDAQALATAFARSADQLEEDGARCRSVLKDPDLLESGLLSPGTCGGAEVAVVKALVALGVDSRWWAMVAAGVRASVALLEGSDDAARVLMTAVDHQIDRTIGVGLARLAPFAVGWPLLGAAEGGGAGRLGGRLGGGMVSGRVLTDHPGVFTHLADGSGGLVDGLAAGAGVPWLVTPRVEDGARLLASSYGDEGRPVVRPVGVGLVGDTRQPRSVRDLVTHLSDVAGLSEHPDSSLNGTVEVQTITGHDGTVRHVVYLPGTDDLATTPWSQDGDVRDMATNAQLMAGQDDTYQQGIRQALHDAGVRPGEPVALVGHSQGGMEAAALLAHRDDAGRGGFTITDVVTAGSPTDQVGAFPTDAHVLSLQQHGDIVPLLDGRSDEDSPQQTTVTFDAHPDGGVLAHHGYPAYVAGAGAADASHDPSVLADLDSLRAHGFLGEGTEVTVSSQVFQITRG